MSLCVRKPTVWVPTRSVANRPVESQKQARSLKISDLRRRIVPLFAPHGSYNASSTYYSQNFKLAFLCDCTDRFMSDMFGTDWFIKTGFLAS